MYIHICIYTYQSVINKMIYYSVHSFLFTKLLLVSTPDVSDFFFDLLITLLLVITVGN